MGTEMACSLVHAVAAGGSRQMVSSLPGPAVPSLTASASSDPAGPLASVWVAGGSAGRRRQAAPGPLMVSAVPSARSPRRPRQRRSPRPARLPGRCGPAWTRTSARRRRRTRRRAGSRPSPCRRPGEPYSPPLPWQPPSPRPPGSSAGAPRRAGRPAPRAARVLPPATARRSRRRRRPCQGGRRSRRAGARPTARRRQPSGRSARTAGRPGTRPATAGWSGPPRWRRCLLTGRPCRLPAGRSARSRCGGEGIGHVSQPGVERRCPATSWRRCRRW